jgi:hypothetical protein
VSKPNPLKDAIEGATANLEATAPTEPTVDLQPVTATNPVVNAGPKSFLTIDPDVDVIDIVFDPNDRYVSPFKVDMDPSWYPRWVSPKHVAAAARQGYYPVPASSVVSHLGQLKKHEVRIASPGWQKQGDNITDSEGYLLMAIPVRGKEQIDRAKREKLLAPHHDIAETLSFENPNLDAKARAYVNRYSGLETDDGGIYRDEIPR